MSIVNAGEPLIRIYIYIYIYICIIRIYIYTCIYIYIYIVDKWKELKALVTLHDKDVYSN